MRRRACEGKGGSGSAGQGIPAGGGLFLQYASLEVQVGLSDRGSVAWSIVAKTLR